MHISSTSLQLVLQSCSAVRKVENNKPCSFLLRWRLKEGVHFVNNLLKVVMATSMTAYKKGCGFVLSLVWLLENAKYNAVFLIGCPEELHAEIINTKNYWK